MSKFIGETPITSLVGTPFEGYGDREWALLYIGGYGQNDGSHHKQWVLDQVARILKGTPVHVTLAKWSDGTEEYRYNTGEPSAEYLKWVEEQKGDYDEEEEEYEYSYDTGIAP